jgi:hypothetical protein
MKRNVGPSLLALLSFAAGAAAGCVPPGARPETPGGVLKECGPDGVIDDFEDNNNQISVIGERGGYWYTYADQKGSTVWPVQGDQGGTFTVVEGGYQSKYAAEVKGKLAAQSIVYAAMGLNFLDPKTAYDASKFAGITFWAKRAPNTTPRLTVKLPDGNTDPDGGICSACFNDYGATINVGEQWQRYVLPFRDLKQEPDWGAPRKPHVDSSRLFAIHWEAKSSGADYDFLVDNIAFICKQ